jgi:hypothetical protein
MSRRCRDAHDHDRSSRCLWISDLITEPGGPTSISSTIAQRCVTGDTRDTNPNETLVDLADPLGLGVAAQAQCRRIGRDGRRESIGKTAHSMIVFIGNGFNACMRCCY